MPNTYTYTKQMQNNKHLQTYATEQIQNVKHSHTHIQRTKTKCQTLTHTQNKFKMSNKYSRIHRTNAKYQTLLTGTHTQNKCKMPNTHTFTTEQVQNAKQQHSHIIRTQNKCKMPNTHTYTEQM